MFDFDKETDEEMSLSLFQLIFFMIDNEILIYTVCNSMSHIALYIFLNPTSLYLSRLGVECYYSYDYTQ